ncbi:hypothetical protein D3C72_826240 [compost metagenome]
MPTIKPMTKTPTYSAARKGADSQANTRNSTAAETPPNNATSSSTSINRFKTSSSFTYFDNHEPMPMANR